MTSKYNIEFNNEIVKSDMNRLTNQVWKLLPMRENQEDWQKQLNTVVIEITGLGEVFLQHPIFLQILSKLEGLLIIPTNFEFYRKTIFEIISLLQEVKNYE